MSNVAQQGSHDRIMVVVGDRDDCTHEVPPLLAGIAGGSGSGKTTLAQGLRELTADFGSVVLSQDDYYFGLPEGVAASDYNFDEPASLDLERLAVDLAALKAGRAVRRPVYDFARHCRADVEQETVPTRLIIVEGLFLFALPALRDLFDLRCFVDVPAEERLRRRVLRDVATRGRSEAEIRDQWERQVEPMYVRHIRCTRDSAHVVLNLPHPDEWAYSEQVVALWGLVEQRLREVTTG
jgi:uridine kinase